MNADLLGQVKKEAHQFMTGTIGEISRVPIIGLDEDEEVMVIFVKVNP